MSNQNERSPKTESRREPQRESQREPSRKSLWAAALLVVLTLAGGLAAHVQAKRTPVDPAPSGTLSYAAPGAGPVAFHGTLDRGSLLEGGDGLVRMELVMSGEQRESFAPVRVDTDLVVVLDRSGSMNGEPLVHAKQAIRELVGRLSGGDRFALVTYQSGGQIAVPLSKLSADARSQWLRTLDGIGATGGTNMAHGLDLAADIAARSERAGRATRVLLLSDGHANEGDHSLEGLRARAHRAISGEYVLSTVGLGNGFDEVLMTALADAGTGNFYFVRNASDLARVFAGEFESARETVAQALVVKIVPASGVEVLDAAGYPLERAGREVRFRPGALFSGQERRIWLTLRASNAAEGSLDLGHFSLAFRDGDARRELAFDETPQVAVVPSEDDFFASIDTEAYERQLETDGLAVLKQSVAESIRAGDRDAALHSIQSFEDTNRSYYKRQNRDESQAKPYRGAASLRGRVDSAFAPNAAPEAKNVLGKSLAEESQDERRQGSKRSK